MGMVILITVDAIANRHRILTMLLVRITGNQLRARPRPVALPPTVRDFSPRARRRRPPTATRRTRREPLSRNLLRKTARQRAAMVRFKRRV
jgi:hypothetical protein